MPITQDLEQFCIKLQLAPGEICVTMPGGARVCASVRMDAIDPTEHAKAMFAQINSALTPLVPIFNIIDFAVAALNCIESIKDALGPPPKPQKMAQCIPELAKKVDALLRLLPQVAIPLLIKEIIDKVLIPFLVAYRARILQLARRLERIVQAETRAATLGSVELQLILDCARADLDVQLANLNSGLEPLNRLLGVINAFLDLAGLDCLPTIDGIDELAEEAVFPIDKLIELLQYLSNLIPAVELPEFGGGAFGKPCDTQPAS